VSAPVRALRQWQGEAVTHGTLARVELEATTLRGHAMVITFHCEGDPALDDCGLGNDGVQPLEPVACE